MSIIWQCPKCGADTPVTVSRFFPAKVWGPPENCYPAEGGEVDPTECGDCGAEIDVERVREMADEADRDAWEARAEEKYNDRKERGER